MNCNHGISDTVPWKSKAKMKGGAKKATNAIMNFAMGKYR